MISPPLIIRPRETERDWDKELAEEVRGECEDKYGPVVGIKVEKETQVCYGFCPARPRLILPLYRARYTSSLILSNLPRKLFKVSTAAFLVDAAFQPLSSPTLCSRPINDRQHSILEFSFLLNSLLSETPNISFVCLLLLISFLLLS